MVTWSGARGQVGGVFRRGEDALVLCESRCLVRSNRQPPSRRLSVWPRRSLRMSPTRSGGTRESSEMQHASRRRLRCSDVLPPSLSNSTALTRACCTCSHVVHPPMRFSNMFCVLEAFSACPRRLMTIANGVGSMARVSSGSWVVAYTYEITPIRPACGGAGWRGIDPGGCEVGESVPRLWQWLRVVTVQVVGQGAVLELLIVLQPACVRLDQIPKVGAGQE